MEQVAQISTHALLAEGDLGGNFALSEQSVISTHALLAEGDSSLRSSSQRYNLFQPTPSLRRATYCLEIPGGHWRDFNPRPPCGGRLTISGPDGSTKIFQPTPSLRRATNVKDIILTERYYFNPRPPCGGRRAEHPKKPAGRVISTHALLAEGD